MNGMLKTRQGRVLTVAVTCFAVWQSAVVLRMLTHEHSGTLFQLWRDAEHNIYVFGIPLWVLLAAGVLAAAIAVVLQPELLGFLPEVGEAAAEGLGLEAETAAEALDAEAAAAAPGDNVYVLGHGPGRMAYEGMEGYNVLNVPNWTPALNDTWIDIGIHENARFLLTSPLGPETLVGQAEFGYQTMYLTEMEQLLNAGYSPLIEAGNLFMVPP